MSYNDTNLSIPRQIPPTPTRNTPDTQRLNNIPTYIQQPPQYQPMNLQVYNYSQYAQHALQPASYMFAAMNNRDRRSQPRKNRNLPAGREIFNPEPGGGILHSSDPAEGEIIIDRFRDHNGNPLCTEVVIRARTMDIFKNQLESERNYLLHKIVPGEPQLPLRERIREIDYQLRLFGDLDATWASTNTPRLLFEKFGESAARITGVPLLGNLRVHRVEFEDGTFSTINRSAAISDFANAATNVSEMKDFIALSDPKTRLTPENINYFYYYYGRDLSKAHEFWPLWQSMKNNIYTAYKTTDIAQLKEILADRKFNLKMQALQDLYVHFQSRPADSENIIYSRISLLNPSKSATPDETGYLTNEKNELMDMKAIYDELDNAVIIFDLDSAGRPFFDTEGRIHMPKDCCTEEYRQRQSHSYLKTVLFNVAVQGNTNNASIQYWLNMEALEKMKNLPMNYNQIKHFNKVYALLRTEPKTDFTMAHKTIRFIRDMGYCSVNCYGGKDRTGYALALETYYSIRNTLRRKVRQEQIPVKLDVTLSKIGRQLMAKEGVAKQIVEDNTGFRVLKLSPLDLHLYNSGSSIFWLQGAFARITDYVKAGAVYMSGRGEPKPERQQKILYSHQPDIEKLRHAA